MDLMMLIKPLAPDYRDIKKEVDLLKVNHPHKTPEQLSKLYIKKVRNKYTSVGVAGALPGIIPGAGTVLQIVVEAGTVSVDVAVMLRWMAGICYASSYIYGTGTEEDFENEFANVLSVWCGLATAEKAALYAGEASVTTEHFDQYLTAKLRNRMNQKIGKKLIAKYGSKRSGIFFGKLIPFGIGAVVGGTFNYVTMKKFGKAADGYFKTKQNLA